MNFDKLDEARREAADTEFEAYDFEAYELEDKSGWEFSTGSARNTDWTRPLYFADPEDPDADTVTGQFTVSFVAGTADIAGVRASINGNDIGRRSLPQPAP